MSGTQVLAIVDDEPAIIRSLRPVLRALGYEVIVAETGEAAVNLIAREPVDCVLLDLGLPDMDGIDVVRRVRDWSHVPIIVVSAREGVEAKVEALDAGADDYLNKPFQLPELLARVRVALRQRQRRASGGGGQLDLDHLKVDFVTRRAFGKSGEIQLTPREYDLLKVLSAHVGQIVTHRQILQAVWGKDHGSDLQAVRVLVGQLRQKIEADPSRPSLLVTETGMGYRLRDKP